MKLKNTAAGISALAVMCCNMPFISASAEDISTNSDNRDEIIKEFIMENYPDMYEEIIANPDKYSDIAEEIAKAFIFSPDTYSYTFDIPNSENKIVVVEKSFLLCCSDNVYLEYPNGSRVHIGYFAGDDGHIPITDDEYEISFSEDSSQVTFTYSFEYGINREDWLSETFDIPENYLAGDVNRDGAVDIRDVSALKKHIARINILDNLSSINADVSDCDGIVDIKDLGQLLKYIIKIVNEL